MSVIFNKKIESNYKKHIYNNLLISGIYLERFFHFTNAYIYIYIYFIFIFDRYIDR